MITELLSGVLDVIKLSPKYFAPVAIAAALLLFLPEQYLELVGVAQLAKDYRPVLGLSLLFSGAVACIAALTFTIRAIARRIKRASIKRIVKRRLGRLNEDEKQILRFYVVFQTRANTLRLDDGVVQSLISAGVLYPASRRGNIIEGFAVNITDTAWEELNKDQTLLLGSTDTHRTDRRPDLLHRW